MGREWEVPRDADGHWRLGDNVWKFFALKAMSEEQLKAFLEAVKADAGFQEKLNSASDLDAAVALALGAGFDVSKADFEHRKVELSDEELEVGGGCFGVSADTYEPLC
jgi:predicted ribosomally synthesized peptide with nif11-like leader